MFSNNTKMTPVHGKNKTPNQALLRTKMVPIQPNPNFFSPTKMESW